MESAHLRKMTKGKKVESKNVRRRSLEGREIRGQLSRDTLEWKVNKRLLGKKQQNEKIMRNKKGTSHQNC